MHSEDALIVFLAVGIPKAMICGPEVAIGEPCSRARRHAGEGAAPPHLPSLPRGEPCFHRAASHPLQPRCFGDYGVPCRRHRCVHLRALPRYALVHSQLLHGMLRASTGAPTIITSHRSIDVARISALSAGAFAERLKQNRPDRTSKVYLVTCHKRRGAA